jgi:hypothetical protein
MAFRLKQPYSHRPTSRLISFSTDDFIKHILSNVDPQRRSILGYPLSTSQAISPYFFMRLTRITKTFDRISVEPIFPQPENHISN